MILSHQLIRISISSITIRKIKLFLFIPKSQSFLVNIKTDYILTDSIQSILSYELLRLQFVLAFLLYPLLHRVMAVYRIMSDFYTELYSFPIPAHWLSIARLYFLLILYSKLHAIPLVILQEKNYRELFATFNNLSTDISLRFLSIDYLWVAVQIAQKHHLFDYSGFSSNSHLIFLTNKILVHLRFPLLCKFFICRLPYWYTIV